MAEDSIVVDGVFITLDGDILLKVVTGTADDAELLLATSVKMVVGGRTIRPYLFEKLLLGFFKEKLGSVGRKKTKKNDHV